MCVSWIEWLVRGVVRYTRNRTARVEPSLRELVFCRSHTSAVRPRDLLEGERTPVRGVVLDPKMRLSVEAKLGSGIRRRRPSLCKLDHGIAAHV